MRISEERQAARLRVAKLAVAIEEGMDKVDDVSVAEICLALTECLRRWQDEQFKSETPMKG